LNLSQALFESPDVAGIVGDRITGETGTASEIGHKKLVDDFTGETEVGQAFAIVFADQLIGALHETLALFEALDFVDQFLGRIRIIAEDYLV